MRPGNWRRHGRGSFGVGQWIALSAAGLVLLGLTFALGLFVGRQWVRPTTPAVSEAAKKTPPGARRGGLSGSDAEVTPRIQDRLTFYQTLTAPLPSAVPATRPQAEDRPRTLALPPEGRSGEARAPSGPEPARPGTQWSVQVAALNSRTQADGVRRKLHDAGFDAYVTTMSDGGETRYRVRVGTFKTREEALRVAERVRAERSLPTLVTPK